MAKSPQDVAAKWRRNLSNSTESIKSGVMDVTVSPTETAAARPEAYVAGVQRAVENRKWQEGLRRVTLGQWQDAMIDKGIARIGQGATKALPKVEGFMAQLLPYAENLSRKIKSMPKGTLEDSKARAVAAIEGMAAFKRRD